jgi:hypothetical protein
MKKLTFLVLTLFSFYFVGINAFGGTNYQHFESIEVTNGKLLENFTEKEYNTYYKNVDVRRFMGWQTYKVTNNMKISYISETLFSYYNDGYTAIDYKYQLSRKKTSKLGLSATGTIGIKMQKDEKGFKNNLDGSLKLSADYQVTGEDKETYDVALKVDPGTQVDLYIYGEGRITNGVAARYIFWIRSERGGFEIFVVTTEFQRLEKKKI